MFSFVVFTFLVASVSCSFVGNADYTGLMSDWTFAYGIASNVSITYHTTSNNTINTEDIKLINNLDIPTGLDPYIFLVPVTSTPIVIGYNIPSLNDTLVVSRSMLEQMFTNTSAKWSDFTLLNPGLEKVPINTRVIYNRNPSTINQHVINFIYDNMTSLNGTLPGFMSNRNVPVDGFAAVVSGLSVSSNSLAFFPYPLIKSLTTSTTIKFAIIRLDDDSTVSYMDPVSYKMEENGSILSMEGSTSSWPLYINCYMAYDQRTTNKSQVVDLFRFFYWVYNGTQLYGRTIAQGFTTFDPTSYTSIKNHLFDGTFYGGNSVLVFTNLSEENRTNGVFALCCIFMSAFLAMTICSWFITEKKYRWIAKAVINRIVVIIGLLTAFAGFVVWWYAPSSDAICTARTWLLYLGFANVEVSVFVYSITMSIQHGSKTISQNNFSLGLLVGILAAFEACEIIILGIWTGVEGTTSVEVVKDPLLWTTIYKCSSSVGYMELIQLVYFCSISVFGIYVIFRHWKKYSPEDTRWLLMAMFIQIVLFILLMVITRLINLEDDQLYVIYIPMFLLLIAIVIFAFILPGLLRKFAVYIKESSSVSKGEKSDTSGTEGLHELERVKSLRSFSIAENNTETK